MEKRKDQHRKSLFLGGQKRGESCSRGQRISQETTKIKLSVSPSQEARN